MEFFGLTQTQLNDFIYSQVKHQYKYTSSSVRHSKRAPNNNNNKIRCHSRGKGKFCRSFSLLHISLFVCLSVSAVFLKINNCCSPIPFNFLYTPNVHVPPLKHTNTGVEEIFVLQSFVVFKLLLF